MNSIAHIGRMALTQLFNSKRFRGKEPGVRIDIQFPATEVDLKSKAIERVETQWSKSYGCYMIWGIEIGLRHPTLKNGEDLFVKLINLYKDTGVIPSHVIVLNRTDRESHSTKSYTVYRISQQQEGSIRGGT